jgi:hypothetical protein
MVLIYCIFAGEDGATVDSSSTGSSGQEPTACVQLLGPHHHYQHLNKTEGNQVKPHARLVEP